MESKTLNPLVWNASKKLQVPIRKKLLTIVKNFLKDVETPFEIKNIYLTGSLCSYEWSANSDWDLHIIVKPETGYCGEMTVTDYFDVKSKVYNKEHDIRIRVYEVEVNIKEEETIFKGKAVFDLLKNKWVAKPIHPDITLSTPEVLNKTKILQSEIDKAIENKASLKKLKELRTKIKELRKSGLESGGEFSIGNLTFKNLRHSGYIKKLYDYKASIQDAALSLESFSNYFNLLNNRS